MSLPNEEEAGEDDCIRGIKYDEQTKPPVTPPLSNNRPKPSIGHLHADQAALRTVMNPLIFGSDG